MVFKFLTFHPHVKTFTITFPIGCCKQFLTILSLFLRGETKITQNSEATKPREDLENHLQQSPTKLSHSLIETGCIAIGVFLYFSFVFGTICADSCAELFSCICNLFSRHTLDFNEVFLAFPSGIFLSLSFLSRAGFTFTHVLGRVLLCGASRA